MTDHDGPSGRAQEYWATSSPEELAGELQHRIELYYEACERKGRLALWSRADELYYGRDAEGGHRRSAAVTYSGERGEVANVRANHFRSLLEHVLAIVTGTRPGLMARAQNADSQSMTQAKLADGLLDYYMEEKHLEEDAIEALRLTVRVSEGWLYAFWDPEGGDTIDDAGTKQGDIAVEVMGPEDVIRDPAHHNIRTHPWLIVHRRMSRWDLLALYGQDEDTAEAIRSADSTPELGVQGLWSREDEESDDIISVYEFYHSKTPAVPTGRYSLMVADRIVLDGELPYERIPVLPAVPETERRTAHGYTTSWDLMSLQQAVDATLSTALSNHDAFGLQCLWVPAGSNWEVDDALGLRVIESAEMPQAVKLLEDQGNSTELYELFVESMQQIRGISGTNRGDPEGVTSGAMAALVHSTASEYNSRLHGAYAQLLEDLGSHLISVLQRYATEPRLADVSGQRNRPMLKEFTGQDIARVRRVAVDLGNAAMRTTQQRIGIADTLLQAKAIDSPEKYLEIVATGRLEPLLDRHDTQVRGIASENERLINGEGARVLWTDDHTKHIYEHLALLDEPTIRDDEDVVSTIVDHLMLHDEAWKAADPVKLAVFGLPPYPAGGVAGMMGAGPQPPDAMGPGGPAPDPNAPPPAPGPVEQNPAAAEAGVEQPNMPKMPTDPTTGEEYQPEVPA